VQGITVRDDKQRGLVAEITVQGTVSDSQLDQALLGLAVPYEIRRVG
jgi:fatty-acyl-CoA synthase